MNNKKYDHLQLAEERNGLFEIPELAESEVEEIVQTTSQETVETFEPETSTKRGPNRRQIKKVSITPETRIIRKEKAEHFLICIICQKARNKAQKIDSISDIEMPYFYQN